jgi:hypothetical protein
MLNCTPTIALEDYMKVEYFLIENDYDLIEEVDIF